MCASWWYGRGASLHCGSRVETGSERNFRLVDQGAVGSMGEPLSLFNGLMSSARLLRLRSLTATTICPRMHSGSLGSRFPSSNRWTAKRALSDVKSKFVRPFSWPKSPESLLLWILCKFWLTAGVLYPLDWRTGYSYASHKTGTGFLLHFSVVPHCHCDSILTIHCPAKKTSKTGQKTNLFTQLQHGFAAFFPLCTSQYIPRADHTDGRLLYRCWGLLS